MIKQTTNSNDNIIPPLDNDSQDKKIFVERWVLMHDKQFYLRQFYDGTVQLSRYDEFAKKWIYLEFPPATTAAAG